MNHDDKDNYHRFKDFVLVDLSKQKNSTNKSLIGLPFEIYHLHEYPMHEDASVNNFGDPYYYFCVPFNPNQKTKDWKCRKCKQDVPQGLLVIGFTRKLSLE